MWSWREVGVGYQGVLLEVFWNNLIPPEMNGHMCRRSPQLRGQAASMIRGAPAVLFVYREPFFLQRAIFYRILWKYLHLNSRRLGLERIKVTSGPQNYNINNLLSQQRWTRNISRKLRRAETDPWVVLYSLSLGSTVCCDSFVFLGTFYWIVICTRSLFAVSILSPQRADIERLNTGPCGGYLT